VEEAGQSQEVLSGNSIKLAKISTNVLGTQLNTNELPTTRRSGMVSLTG